MYRIIKLKNILGCLFIALCMTSCLTEDEQNEIKFKPVAVETSAATSITTNSAVTGGTITAPQERKVTRGVCWSTNPNPEISLSTKTSDGNGLGTFSTSITGLYANTTYYIRAYATSTLSTVYGNQVSVKTAMPTSAILTTNAVSAITSTTATCGGNITSDGGATVTARGVCWSTAANPTISNSKTTDGTGTSAFTSSLTGLVAGTTYYVRAYATNSVGTVYGTQQTFSTTNFPTLTTIATSNITTVSALGGGNISSDGGSSIISCGVCWSTTSNPTTANSTATASGIGFGFTGGYTVSLTLLLPSTTYYVRAYATNGAGTAYGNQVSFTTSTVITLPTLTTNSATSITTTTANSGGSISSDGGAIVTARGVCWSTASNPTTANSKTSNNTGTGSFTSSITGLVAGTTYYVRAYATNSAGTAYGSQVSFSTAAITLPTLTTSTISAITTSTASSGGSISSDGGATVTEKGVCWSTTTNPTTGNVYTHTSNGTGTGTFTSSITGLAANTLYYVRAYATNSAGTAYGSQTSFTTSQIITLPTVTTDAVSSISSTSATGGGNVTNDGGATVTAKGICWSTSTNPIYGTNASNYGGTGTGTFTCSLPALTNNTTYYVRAYATNSVGTAYGNQVSFTTFTPLAIGQSYQGGIIAYLDGSGQHGLIVAANDQSTSAIWQTAVTLCTNLVLNGYSDWYLPSLSELRILCSNKAFIGSFGDYVYWSSSECGTTGTDAQELPFSSDPWYCTSTGSNNCTYKGYSNRVRAVRAF